MKPTGPPLHYDAISASRSEIICIDSDIIMEATGGTNPEYYLIMSRIISFLRSRKGLPYYKNWVDESDISGNSGDILYK